jgi:hypothetical protein
MLYTCYAGKYLLCKRGALVKKLGWKSLEF